MSALNTTSYAILGLLNQHPWSAYELTQFMRVSYLRAVWPRAESRLYEGPKKLVELEYAQAHTEKNGKRNRTVYSITDSGRAALRQWLSITGKDVVFEHEALLKIANSDAGCIEDLRANLTGINISTRADMQEMLLGLELLVNRTDQVSSDDKFVINTLVNSFVYETLLARDRWMAFAEKFTSDWRDLSADERKLAACDDYYRQMQAELNRIVEEGDGKDA